MKGVVVIGAGKIGATVAGLLASTGDYQVTLADRSPEVLGNLDRDLGIRIMAADVEDSLKLVDLLNGQFAVLNAAPFRLTKQIAEAARAAGTHYLDLTEDVVSTRRSSSMLVAGDELFQILGVQNEDAGDKGNTRRDMGGGDDHGFASGLECNLGRRRVRRLLALLNQPTFLKKHDGTRAERSLSLPRSYSDDLIDLLSIFSRR
jgi:hypothetical protein